MAPSHRERAGDSNGGQAHDQTYQWRTRLRRAMDDSVADDRQNDAAERCGQEIFALLLRSEDVDSIYIRLQMPFNAPAGSTSTTHTKV
jgi:hypothetical protein